MILNWLNEKFHEHILKLYAFDWLLKSENFPHKHFLTIVASHALSSHIHFWFYVCWAILMEFTMTWNNNKTSRHDHDQHSTFQCSDEWYFTERYLGIHSCNRLMTITLTHAFHMRFYYKNGQDNFMEVLYVIMKSKMT